MKGLVDLHIHSHFSDGTRSPSELVAMAAEKQLSAIAIADHDTVQGIGEALATAGSYGVEVIPAVELSVQYKSYHDVHLLGYFIDYHDQMFLDKLSTFRKRRDERGNAIIEKINNRLRHQGREELRYEEVAEAAEGVLGRPHIGRILIAKGYAETMQEAFEKFLIPCDVPKLYFPLYEAFDEIKRIGGISVLAHPVSITDNRSILKKIICELAEAGLQGIEAYNNLSTREDISFLDDTARRLGLLVTGGSDFHGSEPDLQMGTGRGNLAVPYQLVTAMRDRRNQCVQGQ